MNKKKKAAIYIRVSTREQAAEGYSLAAQEKATRDFCHSNGYEIYSTYADEGISAKDITHRSGLKALLCELDKIDVIIVWKLTRFTRRLQDLTYMCDLLDKQNVALLSCSESFDSSTPAGRMMRSMLGVVGEFEREVIGENVKFGLAERARQGKRTCHNVIGYDNSGDTLIINEKEAEYVKFVFNAFLKYRNFSEVARICKKEGFRGKRGACPSTTTIKCILTNPVYCGYFRFNNTLNKGLHMQIIEKRKYNKVQTILNSKARRYGSTIKKYQKIP